MKRLLPRVLLFGFQFVLLSICQLASADDAKLDEAKALLDAMRARQSYVRVAEQFSAFGVPSVMSSTEFHNRLYNEMARIYSEVYSEVELQNIRNFFERPVGQAFLDKKPNPLDFLSDSQHSNGDDTNLSEAEALLNVLRARQTLRQVEGQSIESSSVPNTVGTQDFYENLYKGMVRAYAQAYSATELREMREFFESPAGQAFLDKKPLLMEKYQEVIQNILTEMEMR